MHAGRLDRRITIQAATETQDNLGEPIKSWSDLATVWAQLKESRGGEAEGQGADEARQATQSRTFRIRYSSTVSGVGPEHRLKYDGVVHDILAVTEIGRREGLEIHTVARAE